MIRDEASPVMRLPEELRTKAVTPWDVDESKDVNRYTRASDRDGNSEEARARITPANSRLLSKVVEQRRIPWAETRADLVRAGISIVLEMIEGEGLFDAEDAVILHEIRNEDAQIQRKAWIENTKAYIGRSKDLLRTMQADGDGDGIKQELAGLKERAEITREPYRAQMLDLVKEYEPRRGRR